MVVQRRGLDFLAHASVIALDKSKDYIQLPQKARRNRVFTQAAAWHHRTYVAVFDIGIAFALLTGFWGDT